MVTHLKLIAISCVVAGAWHPVIHASDHPEPTPTPQHRTLAALAKDRPLNRSRASADGGSITITNDNLAQLSDGAVVTELTSTAAELGRIEPPDGADAATRQRWRKAVLAQRGVISRLEVRRQGIETKIDRLERGKLDARALDRIAKAESELQDIEREIRRARSVLSRLVRDARKEGAQPGWFR